MATTGPLKNPPGINNGDKGCGFAYADIAWESPSKDQKNAILNLSHPLGESTELHVDAIVTHSNSLFRYAPSVDVFSLDLDPNSFTNANALDELKTAIAAKLDGVSESNIPRFIAIGHRFIGHGNRDWRTTTEEYDISASVRGQLTNDFGYEARVSAYRYDNAVLGDTFVDADEIKKQIRSGAYKLDRSIIVEFGSDQFEQRD